MPTVTTTVTSAAASGTVTTQTTTEATPDASKGSPGSVFFEKMFNVSSEVVKRYIQFDVLVDNLPKEVGFVSAADGNAVGSKRVIMTADGSVVGTETCVGQKPNGMGHIYSMGYDGTETAPLPFQLDDYVSTISLVDTSPTSCLLVWTCTFVAADTAETAAGVTGIYEAVSGGIATQLVTSKPAPMEVAFILNTRGTRVAWLLEELEIPWVHLVPSLGSWMGELDWTNRDLAQAAYTRMGHDFSRLLQIGLKAGGVPDKLANKVPVVNIEGKGWMFESTAILLQILDNPAMGAGKFSGTPEERPQLLQWICFAETIIEHSSSKVITGGLWDVGKEAAMKAARAGMAGQVDMIERELAAHKGDFLLPSGFSAADIACGYSVINSHKRGLLDLEDDVRYPNAWAWSQRLSARPLGKRAWARTKVVKAGKYACNPGEDGQLIPGTDGDFEDPTPDWMAELNRKFGGK